MAGKKGFSQPTINQPLYFMEEEVKIEEVSPEVPVEEKEEVLVSEPEL